MNRLLLASLFLAGVAAPKSPPVPLPPPPNEYPVVWWHDHQSIEVYPGDRVTVKLECWPESSGYKWMETIGDPDILVPLAPPRFEIVPANPEIDEPGGDTIQVFRYVARKSGKVKWSAVYRKGSDRPVDEFEVNVDVLERRQTAGIHPWR